MARIRTIKPDAFASESLSEVPIPARWTFAGLWTMADDDGRLRDEPRLVKAHVYALDDDVTAADVRQHLDALEKVDCIRRYQAGGKSYIAVTNFRDHQRINRPSPSKIPAPPWEETPAPPPHGGLSEDSVSGAGAVREPSPPRARAREVEVEQGSGSGIGKGTPPPPTPSAVEPGRTSPTETRYDGGGGGEDPELEPLDDDTIAATAVLDTLAEAWKRPAESLAGQAGRIRTVLASGWPAPALSAHLAADPPDDLRKPARLLARRLVDIPTGPAVCDCRGCASWRQMHTRPAKRARAQLCGVHGLPLMASGECSGCAGDRKAASA